MKRRTFSRRASRPSLIGRRLMYGIGIVCARLTEAILRDERSVFPVASYQAAYGVTLALPSVLGRGGVVRVFEPPMSPDERAQLERGADRLRNAGARVRTATASS